MKMTRIHSRAISTLLSAQKIATLDELKVALDTKAPATVFRKLGELGYRTSYSHGGRYYTLNKIIRFNREGLWSYDSVWFSRDGTLLGTLEGFIERSEEGCFSGELKARLHVEVNTSLLKLFKQGRVSREKVRGLYLYCSTDPLVQQRQVANREARSASEGTRAIVMSTSRALPTPPRGMPGPAAKWGSAWRPPVPARPTWSPELPMRTAIQFPL